jgi:hypothetical protein
MDKNCKENPNTHFIFNNFYPKIVPFITSKNVLEPERPQIMRYGARALHARQVRLNARAYAPTYTCPKICNTYCFSKATMVS